MKAWQAQDLPRQVTFADGMRKVGFGELPAYPCGGTHVARLAELGDIVISQIKMKKGQLVVSYTWRKRFISAQDRSACRDRYAQVGQPCRS